MPSRKRSKLRQILGSIRTRLVEQEVVTADQIKTTMNITFDEATPHLAPQELYLGVGKENLQMEDNGSAWFDFRCQREINIIVISRMNLDQVDDYETFLEDEDAGLLEIEDDIIDALYDYFPVDSNSNELTVQGMDYMGTSAPQNLEKLTPGWGASMLRFSVIYQRDLTNAAKTFGR